MKNSATARAPANIALIKYWGKRDAELNIPVNDSISFNLSNCYSETTVTFATESDEFILNDKTVDAPQAAKVWQHVKRLRAKFGQNQPLKIISHNSFPAGAGIASSASGFAALTLALVGLYELELSERELTILARQGSGSACRSIPDGFVRWRAGQDNDFSYAESLHPADYWPIHDLVVVIDDQTKSTTSSVGHKLVSTSPLFSARLNYLPNALAELKTALSKRDFTKLGAITEAEALNLHAIMMTSHPSLLYWQPATIALMHYIVELRQLGIECYFTIDAGPNIHLLTETDDVVLLKTKLANFPKVKQIIDNVPTHGARLVL